MSTFEQYQSGQEMQVQTPGISLDLVQRWALWLWLASGWFVIVEPAPYEVLFIVALVVMLPTGLRFHKATIPMLVFLMAYNIGGTFSLWPVSGFPKTKQFLIISVYMATTAIFFANLLADNTSARIAMIKNGYIWAGVLGSIMGLIGYFNIAGMAEAWAPIQRAQGTFKDPNVLSTFLVPPAIFLVQDFLVGRRKWNFISIIALLIIVAGLFFAFSRGAWVNVAGSGLMLVILMFILTHSAALRTRIIILCVAGVIALVGLFFVAMSFESIRSLFAERANLVNSYDGGETGRFGNQLRSLPALLQLPNGFGPLQFAKFYYQDPHNVYLNAFSAYGWLGGFSYLLLILTTIYIGVKTILIRAPWQAFSIAVFCPMIMVILQGIQIDTDHWRHFYILLGMMWGLYAAGVQFLANSTADS